MEQTYLIKDKQTLDEYMQADKRSCFGAKDITVEIKFRSSFKYKMYCYLKVLRQLEYTCFQRDKAAHPLLSRLAAVKVKWLDRKKNRLGLLLDIEIPINHVQKGVRIAHPNVILNGYVGENCVFHGNNVLGNKRTGVSEEVPHIGNGVDVGVGAIIIGNVEIADDCVIGAGAVVTKSFLIPGTMIAGVPAKEIKV